MRPHRPVAGAATILSLGLSAAWASEVAEQAVETSFPQVPRVAGEYEIDGVLDDGIWASALTFDLTIETNPRENAPAPVVTRAYVVENGTTLLVGFDAKDPNPENIRAYLRDRDSAFNDDFVGIVVDTFGDERRAFEFFVNALGIQMDLIQDDVNRNEDSSWDAIWDSAGQINDDGYVVEMAIPFSQLRFPRSPDEQTWSIDLLRIYPREDRALLSISPRERGRNCYLCQLPKVRGFAGAEAGLDIEVVPSLTASRADARDQATGVFMQGDSEEELGVTVSWGITPDLTANLALNPDFSQVEADVPQLDVNNQFSLFFPETRPFFLDGADYFSTPINAVFTRTVADPDFGAKLTGRSDKNTFGVFVAEDAVTGLLFPGPFSSSNETLQQSNETLVGRYTRGIGSNASTIGALVTHRSGDGYSNDVVGVDGRLRISDSHSVRFQYLTSETEYPQAVSEQFDQPFGVFDGDALRVNYNYDAREWWADMSYSRFESGFRADSGFVTQVDFAHRGLGFGHIWHGDDDNVWNQLRVGVNSNRSENISGQLLQRNVNAFFAFNGPRQSYFEIGRSRREQAWNGARYRPDGAFLYGEFRPFGGLFFALNVNVGDQIDFVNSRLGEQVRFEPRIEWNVNRHLLMRLQHTSVELDDLEGREIFAADLSDVRLTWQFNVRSFLRFTAQRQHVERNVQQFITRVDERSTTFGGQLLYSYKVNPQTVFFLGYSDDYVDNSLYGELTRTGRTLFVKLGYAWTP